MTFHHKKTHPKCIKHCKLRASESGFCPKYVADRKPYYCKSINNPLSEKAVYVGIVEVKMLEPHRVMDLSLLPLIGSVSDGCRVSQIAVSLVKND